MKSYQLVVEPEDELLSALDNFPVSYQERHSHPEISQWTVELPPAFDSSTGSHGLNDVVIGTVAREPLQAIHDVIAALKQRHADDPVTLQALTELESWHLPDALADIDLVGSPRRPR